MGGLGPDYQGISRRPWERAGRRGGLPRRGEGAAPTPPVAPCSLWERRLDRRPLRNRSNTTGTPALVMSPTTSTVIPAGCRNPGPWTVIMGPVAMAGPRARLADAVPTAGVPSLALGPGILPGRRPAVIGPTPDLPVGSMIMAGTTILRTSSYAALTRPTGVPVCPGHEAPETGQEFGVGCRESTAGSGADTTLAVSSRHDQGAEGREPAAVGQAPPPRVPITSRLEPSTGKDSGTFMGRGERADHDRWGDEGTPTIGTRVLLRFVPHPNLPG